MATKDSNTIDVKADSYDCSYPVFRHLVNEGFCYSRKYGHKSHSYQMTETERSTLERIRYGLDGEIVTMHNGLKSIGKLMAHSDERPNLYSNW